jgi:hypothetical protein
MPRGFIFAPELPKRFANFGSFILPLDNYTVTCYYVSGAEGALFQEQPYTETCYLKWRQTMGTYGLDELIRRWFKQDLTPDQAVGQMLQLLQELVRRIEDLEGRNRPEGVIGSPRR